MTSLSLVRGVVQNLIVTKGHEDFVFHSSDKNITDVVAIGAAATEQLFNSVILTSAVGDAEISVDRFTCTVNNVVFTGRFHEIQFKSGDEIEFVVEMTQNNGVVYAARSPSMRLLWMMPHQMRGKAAQKKSDVKWSLIIALRSGSGHLNNKPRFISGVRAISQRCRVVHGGGACDVPTRWATRGTPLNSYSTQPAPV
jgi:hypothetical protein